MGLKPDSVRCKKGKKLATKAKKRNFMFLGDEYRHFLEWLKAFSGAYEYIMKYSMKYSDIFL
jgi:hypothetical protein